MSNDKLDMVAEYNRSKQLDIIIYEVIEKTINDLYPQLEIADYKTNLEKLQRLLREIYNDYENYTIQFETMSFEPVPHPTEDAFYHVMLNHILGAIREKFPNTSPELEKRIAELNWIIMYHDQISRELNARPFIR